MASLTAYNLLVKAARVSMKREEAFSKKEISKKLNEIKYLASQKKVPKLSLRKEIIHLENELEKIFLVEDILIRREKQDSVRISALKNELAKLRHRLAMSEDKDLQKKVDKLSYLLGECLSQRGVQQDVLLKTPQAAATLQVRQPGRIDELIISRVKALQERLVELKHKLEISRQTENALPEDKAKSIEAQILYLEKKINEYYEKQEKRFETPPGRETSSASEGQEVKHVMLFAGPPKKVATLPPPPQMKMS
jgi:hypothetical protein